MQDDHPDHSRTPYSDRRLDALIYAVGWVVLISFVYVTAGWLLYRAEVTRTLELLPYARQYSDIYVLLLGIAKLMAVALLMAWLAMLLYRRYLRRMG